MTELDDHNAGPAEDEGRRPPRRRWRLFLVIAAAVAVAATIVGYGILQESRPVAVTALRAGDCLDEPTAERAGAIEIVDCSDPHQLEVFAVLKHPADGTAPFPGTEELLRWADAACEREFAAYVGIDYADSDLFLTHFTPLDQGWIDGDRGVVCLAYSVDELLATAYVTGTFAGSEK